MRLTVSIVLVLAVIAAGVAIWLGRNLEEQPHFTHEATAILQALSPPETRNLDRSTGEVYDNASRRFRDSMLRDKFVDLMRATNEKLGTFRRIVRVVSEERLSSEAGKLFREDLLVEFEEAQTGVSVSFIRNEKSAPWLLLGIEYDIPGRLRDDEPLTYTFDKEGTPAELESATDELLRNLSVGDIDSIFAKASENFAIENKPSEFSRYSQLTISSLGEFKKVISVISSGMNIGRKRARLYVLAQYEKKRTTAALEYVLIKNDWKLERIDVSPDGSSHLPYLR